MDDRTCTAEWLLSRLDHLEEDQLKIVNSFVDQIMRYHDPDVVKAFLNWRRDPRIGSVLDLAADLGDEEKDQLLFFAEGLHDEAVGGRRN